jgi:hypothetical protein
MAGFQGREQIGFAKVVLVLEFQYILHFLAGHLADNRPDQTANFPGDFPGVFPSSESDRDSELFIGLPKWVVKDLGEWKGPAKPTKIGMKESLPRPVRHPLMPNKPCKSLE